MINPQRKWKRAGKPKSKTGCFSCRRRKLKCDERRPICLRCSKAAFDCDYPRGPKPGLKLGNTSLLLPKVPYRLEVPRMHPSGRLSIEVEVENRYFDHFQQKTSSGFQGIMDWSVWNHLILQLCHHESFVRESVVAIGALIRSLEAGSSSATFQTRDDRLFGVANMHRQFALKKYGPAVKAMQAVLPTGEPRQVLVACLLVFCFEILLNNRQLALSHVITGHRMLQDWLTKHNESKLIDRGLLIPGTNIVDDELVDAFEHLDLQISTIYDVRPIELHRTIIREGRAVIKQMPSTFHTLTEARRYLTVIMKQSHHFLATTWQSTESSALVADFKTVPPGPVVIISGVNTNSTPFKVSDSLQAEQKPYAEDILRWTQAFDPLFQRTRLVEKTESTNYATSAMLQMHAIATRILVAGVLFTEETLYDVFLTQFEEMLELINIIVDAHHNSVDNKTSGGGGFVLGLGIVPVLYLLVTRCRDRAIRRKAIEILRGWHPEACWDPYIIAEIGQFILEVEEEGVGEGIIDESSRAFITRVSEAPDQNNGKQKALIQCVQRHGASDGGPVWKERMVYWSI